MGLGLIRSKGFETVSLVIDDNKYVKLVLFFWGFVFSKSNIEC